MRNKNSMLVNMTKTEIKQFVAFNPKRVVSEDVGSRI